MSNFYELTDEQIAEAMNWYLAEFQRQYAEREEEYSVWRHGMKEVADKVMSEKEGPV